MRAGETRVFVFLLVAATLMPPLAGWWVWHELEHRMNVKISGRYSPAFFLPAFTIKDAAFEWDDKVKLVSGNLNVSYEPFSFLFARGGCALGSGDSLLQVKLSGTGLRAELMGEWAMMEGVHGEVPIDHFSAELGFGSDGLREISSLFIHSPAFQFQIKKSETLMAAQNPSGGK